MRSILINATAVSAICSDKVYWQVTPQKVSVPYVVFFAVSDVHQPLYFSSDGSKAKAGQRRYQFTCASDENLTSLDLQHEVMDALRWKQGTYYSYTLEVIRIENMRQRIDPVTNCYLNDVDVMVEYFET